MEKERINLCKANDFVRNALIFIGYPENIEVNVYQNEEERTIYEASYEQNIKGNKQPFLLPLSTRNYFDMLKYGMELKGYEVSFVSQKPANNKGIYFDVSLNVASYGNTRKKSKRRH